MKRVVFVGITDKVSLSPFDSSTKSGAILDQIIEKLNCSCFKMNYVPFAPLNELGKLRYPNQVELAQAYLPFLKSIKELNPDLLVVCGNMVWNELKKHSFSSCDIIKIYHPSYVWVYQKSQVGTYVEQTVIQIKKILALD